MLHIITNPIAGKGKSARYRQIIEDRLRAKAIPHRFHETRSPGDGIRIARQLTLSDSQKCFDIVAMGGDGTLHEVLNGIADPTKVRLGIIPCGSGNDFAAVAGIPATAEGALDVLLGGEVRFTDYLECGGIRGSVLSHQKCVV